MAPEQWQDHPVPATDQYALAVMTYELLTGRPPFQGNHSQLMYQHFHVQPNPPSSINSRISSDIDAVVLRALAKQPAHRFPSIASFDRALQQAVSNIKKTRITLTINQMEAINGTIRTITLPDRRMVTITVPAGAYDGQIIQLEESGIASHPVDPADTVIITINIARVEETVVSLQNSKTIPNTLLDPNMGHNQMPNNQRQGRSITRIMILVIALLLIAGSIVLFYARQNGITQGYATETASAQSKLTTIAQNTKAAQANATATAQAQANATATAQAQQTATAVAAITATQEAIATATAGPLQTAVSVPPVYQDPLNNATNANTVAESWDQNTNCFFAPNGYYEKEDTNWHICGES
jgi:serine/threonine protein kinase